jgi:pimeloyl-ACP methyl ester carboxylesterase
MEQPDRLKAEIRALRAENARLRQEGGRVTPAPAWFSDAVAVKPTDHSFVDEVSGLEMHYCRWGEHDPAKRGLVFVHGGFAHAHWWDFIAPFFMERYNCVAPDLLGCGESEWADEYDQALQARLAVEGVCRDARLGARPIVIGHSLGAVISLRAAGTSFGALLGGCVALDPVIRPPELVGTPPSTNPNVVYFESQQVMRDRFKLSPPQPCDKDYILDHIVEYAVNEVPGQGWTWRFDKQFTQKLAGRGTPEEQSQIIRRVQCDLAIIYGETSFFFTNSRTKDYLWEEMARHQSGAVPIEMPGAGHHLMADEPLALVTALRGILDQWERDLNLAPSAARL